MLYYIFTNDSNRDRSTCSAYNITKVINQYNAIYRCYINSSSTLDQ